MKDFREYMEDAVKPSSKNKIKIEAVLSVFDELGIKKPHDVSISTGSTFIYFHTDAKLTTKQIDAIVKALEEKGIEITGEVGKYNSIGIQF